MLYKYRVYIIDLRKTVLRKSRFRDRNPDYIGGKPCVYVGSTAKNVEERFEQHLAGVRSNKYAKEYGKRLRFKDMKSIRPRKTRQSIEKKEKDVALDLRGKGWAVWSN